MKGQGLVFFVLVAISVRLYGQNPIDVVETTFKIRGFGEEVFYYGFGLGDQLVFSFEEEEGRSLKEVEITELPSSSRFMDVNTKKIESRTLSVPETAIYRFRFSNSAIGGRVCKIKIQRIPVSEGTIDFNSTVYWRTAHDTTYTPTEQKYIQKSDTVARELYSSGLQISSQTALNGNSNRQAIGFSLPDNTVAWAFYIGTGQQGAYEYENAQQKFLKGEPTPPSIPGYGPLSALALTGVSHFTAVHGEDNVRYSLRGDASGVISQFKMGDVIAEASQIKSPLNGNVFLDLLNDNIMDAIQVTVKVAAVFVIQEWNTKIVKVMKVTTREEPYLRAN